MLQIIKDEAQARIEGEMLRAPERDYAFDTFEKLPLATATAMQFCMATRSTNASANAASRSNINMYKTVIKFIRFCADSNIADGSVYTQPSYLAFESHAEQTLRPITSASHLNTLRRLFRFASELPNAPEFRLPAAKSQKAALATSRGPETLADWFKHIQPNVQDRVELNTKLIAELSDFLWERIHQIRDRWNQSVAWREESGDGIATPKTLPVLPEQMPRAQVVRAVVEYLWTISDGFMPQRRAGGAKLTAAQQKEQTVRKQLGDFLTRKYPSLDMYELSDYMKPSHRQIAPFLPLFAMAGLNPVSIFELEIDMLVPTLDGAGHSIKWTKQRAGKQLIAGPWAMRGLNDRSMPRAWEILQTITNSIRPNAAEAVRKFLFLCSRHRVSGKAQDSVAPLENYVTMKILNLEIARLASARWPLLQQLKKPVSLKVLRTTQGSLARFTGEFADAKRFLNHKNASTTDHYLSNSTYKAYLDDKIINSQIELYSFLVSRPTLIPNDVDAIVASEDIGRSDAQALMRDEFNLGFGVSNVHGKLYVVDTPLNYKRMRGWLDCILAAHPRLEAANIERWRGFWMPQIELFREALEDFPRKTRAAAALLNVKLSFPEPH